MDMTLPRDPAIRVLNASKHFSNGKAALRDIQLTIEPGEMIALLGVSGSGKSTLIRCLSGLCTIDDDVGQINIDGQCVQRRGRLAPAAASLRGATSVVFQQFNLVGQLSVLHNVIAGASTRIPRWQMLIRRYPDHEVRRALEALVSVGLGELAGQRASTLSGGQQQRAALARALVQGARILLADEPVASLDPESAQRVMRLLTRLNQDMGITAIVSLHQVELARQYCRRTVALSNGKIIYDGPSNGLCSTTLEHIYQSSTVSDDEPRAFLASHA
jgi:phosphonate transport system ATP-binding protein